MRVCEKVCKSMYKCECVHVCVCLKEEAGAGRFGDGRLVLPYQTLLGRQHMLWWSGPWVLRQGRLPLSLSLPCNQLCDFKQYYLFEPEVLICNGVIKIICPIGLMQGVNKMMITKYLARTWHRRALKHNERLTPSSLCSGDAVLTTTPSLFSWLFLCTEPCAHALPGSTQQDDHLTFICVFVSCFCLFSVAITKYLRLDNL